MVKAGLYSVIPSSRYGKSGSTVAVQQQLNDRQRLGFEGSVFKDTAFTFPIRLHQ